MQSSSLAQQLAHQINAEAPQILGLIRGVGSHLEFLVKVGETKAIDARGLLQCVNGARRDAMQLQHRLTNLAEMRSMVRRRHLGDDFGAFASGYQGIMKRIAVEFDGMKLNIERLNAVATEKINEPSRWGDAALEHPVNDLASLLGQLLEFWGLLRTRVKLDA